MFNKIVYDKSDRRPIAGHLMKASGVGFDGRTCFIQIIDGRIMALVELKDVVYLLVPVSSRNNGPVV